MLYILREEPGGCDRGVTCAGHPLVFLGGRCCEKRTGLKSTESFWIWSRPSRVTTQHFSYCLNTAWSSWLRQLRNVPSSQKCTQAPAAHLFQLSAVWAAADLPSMDFGLSCMCLTFAASQGSESQRLIMQCEKPVPLVCCKPTIRANSPGAPSSCVTSSSG